MVAGLEGEEERECIEDEDKMPEGSGSVEV